MVMRPTFCKGPRAVRDNDDVAVTKLGLCPSGAGGHPSMVVREPKHCSLYYICAVSKKIESRLQGFIFRGCFCTGTNLD